ncbi:hypothetical protein GF406_00020 [candidate division KSB1 bacterium]|nr:hypothetical protein [candidate division KSB1 bacterium]
MIVILLLTLFSTADLYLPEWQSLEMHVYFKDNLYGYINGGAELFKEFGFNRLSVQHFKIDSSEIAVNLYEMSTDTSALGIYLAKCGTENPWPDINMRHTVNPYQVTALMDNYFIQIDNFSGNSRSLDEIYELLEKLDKQTTTQIDPFFLPESFRIANSERLIRGPFALQPLYTFGQGDIFNLNGEIFAQYARYKKDTKEWALLVIPYPDEQDAQKAFANVCANLDPYHTVINHTTNTLIFKDYKNKFGKIELRKEQLFIQFGLPELPQQD